MYVVTIPGEPKGKQRPRMTRQGITYTPKETVVYENLVKTCFQGQNPNYKYIDGYIRATISAYYSIPKSVSKKKRQQMIDNIIRPTKKPDLDNVAKMILDALNKVAYDDDKQVVELIIKKYYAEMPFTKLVLEEIQGDG